MKRSRLDDPSPEVCYGHRGTITGYGKHIKASERPCERCRDAYNAYQRKHRKRWLSDPSVREHDRMMRNARERAKSALANKYATEYRSLVQTEIRKSLADVARPLPPASGAPNGATDD